MQQLFSKCSMAEHQSNEIEYVCAYKTCKEYRFICYECISSHHHNQNDNQHIINKRDYYQQSQQQIQSIKNAKYLIHEVNSQYLYSIRGITNDLKYILQGNLNVWNFQMHKLTKQIKFKDTVLLCKFTEDSQLLYVVTYEHIIYLFKVKKEFKLLHTYHYIQRDFQYTQIVYNISNAIILILNTDGTNNKVHFNQKKQLSKIQVQSEAIFASDYNKILNIIAIASDDQYIKLRNANTGQLITESLISNGAQLYQILFINQLNLLVSQDDHQQAILWNFNLNSRQLQQLQLLDASSDNISVNHQFIFTKCGSIIKMYSIDGEVIRQYYSQEIYLIEALDEYYNLAKWEIIYDDSILALIIFYKDYIYLRKIELN